MTTSSETSGLDARLQAAVATAVETHALRFGPGVLAETGQVFAEQFPGCRVLVVADQNTYAVAGEAVVASLAAAGVEFAEEPFIFPGTPTLDCGYDKVTIVRERLRGLDNTVCCSIAAGTLNDVAKLASGELGRPYLNVCTAASVDGYTAFGASIARDGFKITRACAAPAALIADTLVMAAAPARLTATGYGDLIEKIPAGADWILADELGVEPITAKAWEMVQPASRRALERPDLVAAGDLGAISALAEANLLSGLAMQVARSSRPASGAGHLFSHVWEMEGHGQDWEPPLSHGFKVGIGTIGSCALWEAALRLDLEHLDVDALVAQAPTPAEIESRCRALLAPHIVDAAVEQSMAKHADTDTLRQRLVTLQNRWPRLRERAEVQLVGPQAIMDRLRIAGAPHHPDQIGIGADRLKLTYLRAQLIRARYTIFDVLAELQLLEATVDGLFAAGGFWERHPWTR